VLKNVPFPRSSRTCNYRRPKSGEIKRGDDVPALEIIGVDDLFSYPSPKEIKGELVDSSLIEVLNSIVIESEREGCRDEQIRSQNQTGLGRIDGWTWSQPERSKGTADPFEVANTSSAATARRWRTDETSTLRSVSQPRRRDVGNRSYNCEVSET